MTDKASKTNRRSDRKGLAKRVEVATGLGPNLKCVMKDVSQEGARLTAAHGWSAPDVFLLILRPDLHRWCQVAWRSDHELGVHFISPPRSIAAGRSKLVIET